ncbi:MAG: sel1 repeat family protein, partial [Emcibacter sp.]|nr:sel1 repeat family protein [Emcibacter sp.]
MFSSPAQAGILSKLNPFSSGNSKIDTDKIEKNLAKTIEKLKKKAQKDPRVMAALAEYYNSGIGITRDKKRALDLYQRAYKAGDAVALYHMGEYYLNGLDVDKDGIFEIPKDITKGRAMQRQAVQGISKIAGKKDGEALYLMGLFHYRGLNGVEKNRKKARKYFDKGADRNYAKAMYWFGEILLTEGGKKHPEACDYFYKSAYMDYPQSIYAIGYCYEKGRGRAKDAELAQEWYDYGTSHHSTASMISMGDIYINKSGDENKQKAAEYYDMAIAEGSARGYEGYARAAHDEKKAYYYQQALAHDLGNANYLKEVQNYREKDSNGTEKIIGLEPKTYSRDNILSLAQKAAAGDDGAKEVIKDFMLMGYVKSLEPVTLLTLDNGFNDEYGTALFFSPDNKTLTITRTFGMSIYRQTVNSTWDVATKTLLSITVLDPGYNVLAVSDDGKKFAMEVRVTKFWEHPFTGDAILTLNVSESGKILFKLKDLDGDDLYGFGTYFTGDDKFLNVYYDTYLRIKKKSQNRGSLYNVITGKNVTDDRGYVRRKVSPNGLHVMTRSRPNEGDDYPDKALKHQRLPDWDGGKKLDEQARLEFDEGIFSPDSRYWITPEYIYDLKEDKDLGKHDAAHNTSIPFKHIPGTSLLVRIYKNAINTYLMEGSSIMKVASMPMDVKWSKFELDHIFSPDFTKITINGVREGSANKETYIQSYKKPTADKIAKERKSQQEELKKKKQMAAVMEMFEVGFDDQAMEQMNVIIENDPTSTDP